MFIGPLLYVLIVEIIFVLCCYDATFNVDAAPQAEQCFINER